MFGKLRVIQQDGVNKWGHILWLCRCSCESKTLKRMTTQALKRPGMKGCGCMRTKKVDLTGQTYGNLKVLKRSCLRARSDKNPQKQWFWLCRCSCGNTAEVSTNGLRSGHVRSCGCLVVWRRNKIADDAIRKGMVFGSWTVTGDSGVKKASNVLWKCRCSCGTEKSISRRRLLTGKSTKCLKCMGVDISSLAKRRNGDKYSKHRRSKWVIKEIKRLHSAQGGVCPVCLKPLPDSLSLCAWDHDHETGRGRAMLHRGCNVFVGFLENRPEIVSRAMEYLETWKK